MNSSGFWVFFYCSVAVWSTFLVSVYTLQMKLGLFNLSPKLRVQS